MELEQAKRPDQPFEQVLTYRTNNRSAKYLKRQVGLFCLFGHYYGLLHCLFVFLKLLSNSVFETNYSVFRTDR